MMNDSKELQREIKRLKNSLEEQQIAREVEKQRYKNSVNKFKTKIRVLRQKSPIHTPGRCLSKSRSYVSEFSPEEQEKRCKCSEEYLEVIEELERSLVEKQTASNEYIYSLKKSITLQDSQIEHQQNEMKTLVRKFKKEYEEMRNSEMFESRREYEFKVEEIKTAKDQEIADLRKQFEDTIIRIQQEHKEETDNLSKTHREIQQRNQIEYFKEVETLNQKFEDERTAYQTHYEDKIQTLLHQLNPKNHITEEHKGGCDHPLIEFENVSQLILNTGDSNYTPQDTRTFSSFEQTRTALSPFTNSRRPEPSNREWNKALVNLLLRHSLIQ